MEGPVIFIACLVAVTLGILIALYAIARDVKPKHRDAPFSLYRQPNDKPPFVSPLGESGFKNCVPICAG